MELQTILEQWLPQLLGWAQGIAPKLLLALIIFYVGRTIVRKLSGATVKASQSLGTIDKTLAHFLGSVVFFIGLIAVVVAALSALNISLGFIAGIVGALMIALGFALQESLGDLASGIMLAFFRHYKVGDEVEIDGERGKVTHLDLFIVTTAIWIKRSLQLHLFLKQISVLNKHQKRHGQRLQALVILRLLFNCVCGVRGKIIAKLKPIFRNG